MKVEVLAVRKTPQGLRVAQCKLGDLYGTALATPDVNQPGEYDLKMTIRVTDGKLTPLVRVEKAK